MKRQMKLKGTNRRRNLSTLDRCRDGGLPVRSASSDTKKRHCNGTGSASPCFGSGEMAMHKGMNPFCGGDLSWYTVLAPP